MCGAVTSKLVGIAAAAALVVAPSDAVAVADHATTVRAKRNGLIAAELLGPCEEFGQDCIYPDRGVIVVRPDSGDARLLPVPLSFHAPMFSGDGRYLAFVGDRIADDIEDAGEVAVTNADGTGRHWVSGSGSTTDVGSFDWSPTGHTLVYARYGAGTSPSQLVRVDANGRSRLRLGFGESPFWSPDGRLIAYTRGTGRGGNHGPTRIMVMRRDGHAARTVRRTPGTCDSLDGWTLDGRGVLCSVAGSPSQRRAVIDVATGRIRGTIPAPGQDVVSPDGRLRARITGRSILIGPRGGKLRRILGPPTRWRADDYASLDWQPLPSRSQR